MDLEKNVQIYNIKKNKESYESTCETKNEKLNYD